MNKRAASPLCAASLHCFLWILEQSKFSAFAPVHVIVEMVWGTAVVVPNISPCCIKPSEIPHVPTSAVCCLICIISEVDICNYLR